MWKSLKQFLSGVARWPLVPPLFYLPPSFYLPPPPPPPPTSTRTVTLGYDRIIFVSEEGAAAVAYVKTAELKEYVL